MTDKKTPPDEWDEPAKPEQTLDPVLTKDEIAAIRKQARDEILADKRKNAKQQFLALEKARLATEEGLTTGNTARDQMVRITIELAEFAPAIFINMKAYRHGQTYTVPRHVAETLREIMSRTAMHANEVEGKSRKHFYQKAHETEINPVGGVKNAPRAIA